MTESIQERDAGRELDAEVAERVFGWAEVRVEPTRYDYPHDGISEGMASFDRPSGLAAVGDRRHSEVPCYSTSIRQAFRVVDAIRGTGWDFSLRNFGTWTATFEGRDSAGEDYWSADAETAALAICRAALMLAEAIQ